MKKKFVKKPVVIEAYQTDKEMVIQTLEGPMQASVGDWIITGIRGEEYPCKPDVFARTYEEVPQDTELTAYI
jgi:gp119